MFHRMLPNRRVNTTSRPNTPFRPLRFHVASSEQPVPHETHCIPNPATS